MVGPNARRRDWLRSRQRFVEIRSRLGTAPRARYRLAATTVMPRYHFNIYDDEIVTDREGLELPDEEAARAEGLRGARDLMCAQLRKGRLNLSHRVEVIDERGGLVLVLPFGDAVIVEP
jgi:hypothetical protein